jgi:hypothetical protein
LSDDLYIEPEMQQHPQIFQYHQQQQQPSSQWPTSESRTPKARHQPQQQRQVRFRSRPGRSNAVAPASATSSKTRPGQLVEQTPNARSADQSSSLSRGSKFIEPESGSLDCGRQNQQHSTGNPPVFASGTSCGGEIGLQKRFEASVRQFNNGLDPDSFHESSCATPLTTCSSSGGGHPYTTQDESGSSNRNSILSSCPSSHLSVSQMSQTQSFQQSLDSGYGASSVGAATTGGSLNHHTPRHQMVENPSIDSGIPSSPGYSATPIEQEYSNSTGQSAVLSDPVARTTLSGRGPILRPPTHPIQSQALVSEATTQKLKTRLGQISEKDEGRQVSSCGRSDLQRTEEAETQTDDTTDDTYSSDNNNHEYTELELNSLVNGNGPTLWPQQVGRLRAASRCNHTRPLHHASYSPSTKRPARPSLAIPPPPRKPLPPVPTNATKGGVPSRQVQARMREHVHTRPPVASPKNRVVAMANTSLSTNV